MLHICEQRAHARTCYGADHNKQKGSVYMVFEYAEHDLAGLMMKQSVQLGWAVVKHFMKQVCGCS